MHFNKDRFLGPLAKSVVELIGASGQRAKIESIDSGETVLSVVVENAHHSMWNHFFDLELGINTTLNGAVTADSKVLEFTDASSFNVGGKIDIHEGLIHRHHYREIISIAVNTVTIDAGVDFNVPDGSQIDRTGFNMAVDGSVTPQVFTMKPQVNEIIDCTILLFEIVDNAAADDSRFGGSPALTNGVHIRKNINNGQRYETIAVWKFNKDMKEDMFDVVYTDKAGGGNFGVNGRWVFAESQAVINLRAGNNEFLECVIQDDLTGLVDFQIKVQGKFN